MTKGPLYNCSFYNFAKRFHDNQFLTVSSLSHALCRNRPGVVTFKRCKNVNGRFNETTLRKLLRCVEI